MEGRMKKKDRNRGALNVTEYAILVALVIAALTAMKVYVARGVQAKIRDGVDGSLSEITGGQIRQYEPYYIQSSLDSSTHNRDTESELAGSAWDRGFSDTSTQSGFVENTEPINN